MFIIRIFPHTYISSIFQSLFITLSKGDQIFFFGHTYVKAFRDLIELVNKAKGCYNHNHSYNYHVYIKVNVAEVDTSEIGNYCRDEIETRYTISCFIRDVRRDV